MSAPELHVVWRGTSHVDLTGLTVKQFSALQCALTEAARRYTEIGLPRLAVEAAQIGAAIEQAYEDGNSGGSR